MQDEWRIYVCSGFDFFDWLATGIFQDDGLADVCGVLAVILEPAIHEVPEVEEGCCHFGQATSNLLKVDIFIGVHIDVDIEVAVIAPRSQAIHQLV